MVASHFCASDFEWEHQIRGCSAHGFASDCAQVGAIAQSWEPTSSGFPSSKCLCTAIYRAGIMIQEFKYDLRYLSPRWGNQKTLVDFYTTTKYQLISPSRRRQSSLSSNTPLSISLANFFSAEEPCLSRSIKSDSHFITLSAISLRLE